MTAIPYEVGAIFKIVDMASGPLKAVSTQLKEMDALIRSTQKAFSSFGSMGLGKMAAELKVINEQMAAMAKNSGAIGAGMFAPMAREIDGAVAGVRTLKAELASLKAETRGLNIPGVVGLPGNVRSGGAHGGAGGVHFGGYQHFPGGHMSASGVGGMAGMAALGALGYGVALDAQINDVIAKAMLTGGLQVDAGMTKSDAYKHMRDVIARTSAMTGYGPKEVGEALLTTERQMGGMSFKDRLKLEELLIPYAASEARMKETSLKDAFEAMVGLAHMTGTYDQKKLPELMRQFQYVSMITPVDIKRLQNSLSYSMPMLTAGGMSPGAVMFLTAMAQTAGITNTKSGTWIRSFFEKAEPSVALPGGKLTPGEEKHNDALKMMGFIGADSEVLWKVMGKGGKVDWDASILRVSELMSKFLSTHDPATRLSVLHRAFGERGGGFGALMNLPEFVQQFPILQDKMRNFRGGTEVLTSLYEASTEQKARTAWANTQSILMDIGETVLPRVNSALDKFNGFAKALKDILGEEGFGKGLGAGFGKIRGHLPDVGAFLLEGNPIYTLYKTIFEEAKKQIPPMINEAKSFIGKKFSEVGTALREALPSTADILGAMQTFGARMKEAIGSFFDGIGAWIKQKLGSLFSPISYGGAAGAGGGIINASYGGGGGSYGGVGSYGGGVGSRGRGGGYTGGGGSWVGGGVGPVHVPAGHLTPEQGAALLRSVGASPEEAIAIGAHMGGESNGNPRAHNFVGRDRSYGLWQINMLGAMGEQRRRLWGLKSNEDLYDPATNARAALYLYRHGGMAHWAGSNRFMNRAYTDRVARGARGWKPESERPAVVPPPAKEKVEIHTHFNVDGRKLTQVVEGHLVRKHAIPRGPNTHDSSAGYSPTDLIAI